MQIRAIGEIYTISPNEETWGMSFFSRGITLLPRVLECGGTVRENGAPLCRNVDWLGATDRLIWYKYIK